MAAILPSQVPVGTITGTMQFVDEDSWDVDTDPELIVVSGTVTFTASVRTLRMPTFQTILVPLRFDCTFDNQGNLVPKVGNGLGVKLPATNSPLISEQDYTWRVEFNLREVATGFTVRLDSFNIQVPVGSTQDLSTLIPISESPGTITIQGPPGQAATVSVGTTTTSAAGTNASVTVIGEPTNPTLNFTIPRGPKGDTGDGGVPTGGTALQYLRKNAGNTALEYASLTKASVGLGNADNTTDLDKPVSTPQATAINAKVAKGELIINVMDAPYNATGNGTTDDAAAIQAAITAGEGSGKTVWLPNGQYRIQAPLRALNGNLILRLSSGATILRYGNNGMFINGAQSQTGNGSSNISISGGTWDARGIPNNVDGSIICIGGGDNISVRDCTLKNVNLSHIAEIAGCSNVTFDNIKFGGYGGAVTKKEAFQIERLITGGFPYFNNNSGTPCINIRITNCTQLAPEAGYARWAVAVGNHEDADVSTSSDITITNCNFGACTNRVISSDFWTNVRVTNTTGSAPTGATFTHNAVGRTNIQLSGNTLAGTTAAGVLMVNCTGVTSSRDAFSGTYGLSIQGSREVTVDRTSITGTSFEACIVINGSGVTRQQKNITLTNCGLAGTGALAIYGDSRLIGFKECFTLSPLSGSAVTVRGTSTAVQVTGNTLEFTNTTSQVVQFVTNTTGKVGVSGNMYPTANPLTNTPGQVTSGTNFPIL